MGDYTLEDPGQLGEKGITLLRLLALLGCNALVSNLQRTEWRLESPHPQCYPKQKGLHH